MLGHLWTGAERMDFLTRLKELLQADTQAAFARLCGQRQSNMSNYLSGNARPGIRALEGCLLNAAVSRVFNDPPDPATALGKKARALRSRVVSGFFAQEVVPHWEIEPVPDRQKDLPRSAGVYVLYDSSASVLYVDQAKNFRNEVWNALGRKIPAGMHFGWSRLKKTPMTYWESACYVSLYQIENAVLRHNIEAFLIRVFINQTHNRNLGRFKSG